MKKPTLASIAKKHGLNLETLKDYRKQGVNVYDDDALELHLLTLGDAPCKEYSPDGMGNVKEEFIAMKFQKLTHEVQLKKAEATLKNIEVDKRRGELVPINEVCETNLLVSSKVKAQLKALTLTLPPKLEGLSIKQMSKVIDDSMREVLEYLCGELNIEEHE